MNGIWEEISIEEIKSPARHSLAMGPFGSNIKTDNFVPDGVPIIRGGNLTGEHFKDTDFVFLTEEKADELKSANAFPGDIVFTHRGTLGQVGIIPKKAKYPRYVVSQSQMKLTCDRTKVNPEFVYYYFRSEKGQHELLSNTSTTGVPAISSPLSTLRSLQIPYPPLPTQHSIARILGSLDDKIELNRQINETLEAMARAIFQSWFVDFDPVRAKAEGRQPAGMDAETAALFPDSFEEVDGREVPRGWGVGTIGDYIEVVKGLSYKGEGLCDDGIPMHNLNSVLEGGGYKYRGIKFYNGEYHERHIIHPGDVIVTNTEQGFDFLLIGYPAIIPKFYGETGLFSHHTFRVRPLSESPLTNHFIYYLLMSPAVREQVIGCTNGTTVNMMYIDGLITPQFILPSAQLIKEFEKIVSPMFDLMENNEQQSRTLAQSRDALLPKLMSGEMIVDSNSS